MNQNYFIKYSNLIYFLLFSFTCHAENYISSECEPLKINNELSQESYLYGNGILWRVYKGDSSPSFVLGTIHVSDARILELPEVISASLKSSKTFVMEALPDAAQIAMFTTTMFYDDGTMLNDVISPAIYDEVLDILSEYMLPAQLVGVMKPWAAYLTMNYPPETGQVLDLELMSRAKDLGLSLKGLETLIEQGEIFSSLNEAVQIKLLVDSTCHHSTLKKDFEIMKDYYLARDLEGLANYSNRYEIADDKDYQDLMESLLINRNYKMSRRMQETLNDGHGFIAIGALHLPGEEGVLNLLSLEGYTIEKIY
jgi:uncharacterized protein YbaP (TraB family)